MAIINTALKQKLTSKKYKEIAVYPHFQNVQIPTNIEPQGALSQMIHIFLSRAKPELVELFSRISQF